MRYRNLGKSPLKVSELCLGTMMFGGPTEEKDAARIVARAREAGINFIDTADVYTEGRSEEITGRAVKADRSHWIVATKFGKTLEPKRAMRTRGWRKVGAAVVRWPGPILVATIALSLIGLLALPGYRTNYNDRNYLPADLPANAGYSAADRHFSQARMNPELLLIESDHDLRNSSDFLVIDKVAKSLFRVPGVGRVQAITRPQGTPIEHTSIPFQISMNGVSQKMNEKYQQDMMANMLKQANDMQTTIDTMTKMQSITEQMAAVTHSMVVKMKNMTMDVADMRDHISDFDDFFRPLRNYLYWEPHCFDIPVCSAFQIGRASCRERVSSPV